MRQRQRLLTENPLMFAHAIRLQDLYECYFPIADIANPMDLVQVKHKVAEYLAAGVDPKSSVIYLESAIPAFYEIYTLLNLLHPTPPAVINFLQIHPDFVPVDSLEELQQVKEVIDALNRRIKNLFTLPIEGVVHEKIPFSYTQERYEAIVSERGFVEEVLYEGTLKAEKATDEVLDRVRHAMHYHEQWEAIAKMAHERKESQLLFGHMGSSP